MAKSIPNLFGVPKNAGRLNSNLPGGHGGSTTPFGSAPRVHQGMPRTDRKVPFDAYVSQFDLPGVSKADQRSIALSFQAGLMGGAPSK